MDTKPKRFTVHGIFGKALMETAKDVFTGNLSSTVQDTVKKKIENRLNTDDDLQTYIADTVIQQIKRITAMETPSNTSSPTPPVVEKVLRKIIKITNLKNWLFQKLN